MTFDIDGPVVGGAQWCQPILRELPEWFGIESAIRDYVRSIDRLPTWLARAGDAVIGFVSVDSATAACSEIVVMGVGRHHHRRGVGSALVDAVEADARARGVRMLEVKTLSPTRPDAAYAQTRRFYLARGFSPVQEFPDLWDAGNPCLQMIKPLCEGGDRPACLVEEPEQAAAAVLLAIHEAAFEQPAEGRLVAELADGGWLRLSLAARRGRQLVGHIAFSALELNAASDLTCWSLAPLGVLPAAQRCGVGSMLVRAGLRLAQLRGADVAFVLGDPAYYGRFGFAAEAALRVESQYDGPAHQAVELRPGAFEALGGELRYAPPFRGVD